MQRSRQRRNKSRKNKPPKREPPTETRERESIWKRLLVGTASLATLAGLIIFWPRMTMESNSEFEASNPRDIQFALTNTGYISLRDIRPMIGICEMILDARTDVAPPKKTCNGPLTARVYPTAWHVSYLGLDETDDLRLDASSPTSADGAIYFGPGRSLNYFDFSIAISYKPWIFPITGHKEFRFSTRDEGNGKISIFQRPLEK